MPSCSSSRSSKKDIEELVMSAIGINHVALTVNEWERSKRFYTGLMEAMGAKVLMEVTGAPHKEPDGRLLVFGGKGFMVTVWEAKRALRGNKFELYNVGLHHAAFGADSRASVDRVGQLIPSIGGTVLDAPAEYAYVPGYYATYFTDPDGLKLEYVHVPG
jgi:glyoxylase I family protein